MELLMTGITNKVRPTSLDEIVGMEQNKRIVRYSVEGAMKRNEPIPSFIVGGPSGTGKSTISSIIASLTKGEIWKFNGSDIKSADEVYDMAAQVKDGDIVFVEEAHTLGGSGKKAKLVQSILYEWIEDFKLSGGSSYGVLTAPKTSFVFATTDPGQMSEPLRIRCKRLDTNYYSLDEMKEIINRAATKLGLDFATDDAALTLMAQSSRGVPRIAIMQRLDMFLNVAACNNTTYCLDAVQKFLGEMGINDFGLEPNDILYCKTLYEKMSENNNKPVAKKTLEQSTGLADNIVDNIIEPYLQQTGIIKIESKGRILTNKGCEVLGVQPPLNSMEVLKYHLDENKLTELLDNAEMRKGGMSKMMPALGLNYTNAKDRSMFKAMLIERGWTAVQKAGIIKLT